MARIEHIKRRLDNWALWRARRDNNGLGFPSQNILAVWGANVEQPQKNRESVMPVLHLEAEETDKAVESLKGGKSHLYETLHCIYVRDLGVTGTARQIGRAPSTVHAQLDAADRAIDAWLVALAQEKERKRAAFNARDAHPVSFPP
ncbi:hypothetical protein DJFAAGMI_01880 [Comamonas sp. PE63]|uniref:Uncharacterized protein n=1 Tax=Comamonas brasiliensis TaxID=1812482 RepID=A0ABS5LRM5_9BURK|nr:hypothetical protein [Comamonas sp. PE63]MBS3019141.1 hypothetical protein [Comamonas sp. PE63]